MWGVAGTVVGCADPGQGWDVVRRAGGGPASPTTTHHHHHHSRTHTNPTPTSRDPGWPETDSA